MRDDARVHAPAETRAGPGKSLPMCNECGAAVAGAGEALFCSSVCRHAWNNRRRTRGAQIYDLYMAHRYERREAGKAGVLSLINRLASNFHREDEDARQGRKSWRPLRAVLADHPSLRAVVVWRGRRKKEAKG